jgi:hypothetical protein
MRDPAWYTGTVNQQSVTLPRCAPAAGLILVVGAGMCLAGPIGTHPTGGRVASLLNGRPLPTEILIERRRRSPATAGLALSDIRRWTDLAWDSIAEILGVSRKSVHNWASGDEPTGANVDRLSQLHERAQELHARHGPAMAGVTLAIENGAKAKISRSSPRTLPADVGPVLVAQVPSNAPVLRAAGKRARVRQG